jgi:HAD superfamily hydrolase (TIGR01549 family)
MSLTQTILIFFLVKSGGTMLSGKKLLIFDCDGVLFDSNRANIAYFERCLEIAGLPPIPEEEKDKVTFMSIRQLIDELIKDRSQAERLYSLSQGVDYEPFIGLLRPLFNFDDVFPALREKFYLAVASNRGGSLIKLFHHFNLFRFFHYKVSTLEAKSKPDPEMLEKCLRYFGTDAEHSVFIGDSESDRETAANAGVDFIWSGRRIRPYIESAVDLLNGKINA